MERTPNGTNHTLLVGPIDTQEELKTILAVLKQAGHLKRLVRDEEINRFLHTLKRWRQNHIEGPIDTPREIAIFFGILRDEQILSGPIDTPAEIKLFMEKLQQMGILQTSFVDLKPKPLSMEKEEPTRRKKRKKRHYDDEDYDPPPRP